MEVSIMDRTFQPPSEASLGRRPSLTRKKPVPQTTEVAIPADDDHSRTSMTHEQPSISEHAESESQPPLSRVDTSDHEHVQDEFSRFDQGPLTDAPAFVPEEHVESDHEVTPYAERKQASESDLGPNHAAVAQSHQTSVYATPMEADAPERHTRDNMQDEEHSQEQQPLSPAADRWAQIRKNAAERNARPSEDNSMRSRGQSTVTQNTEGASETSGEECKSCVW